MTGRTGSTGSTGPSDAGRAPLHAHDLIPMVHRGELTMAEAFAHPDASESFLLNVGVGPDALDALIDRPTLTPAVRNRVVDIVRQGGAGPHAARGDALLALIERLLRARPDLSAEQVCDLASTVSLLAPVRSRTPHTTRAGIVSALTALAAHPNVTADALALQLDQTVHRDALVDVAHPVAIVAATGPGALAPTPTRRGYAPQVRLRANADTIRMAASWLGARPARTRADDLRHAVRTAQAIWSGPAPEDRRTRVEVTLAVLADTPALGG